MSKFLGFLLGIAVALVGPAMFGVLAADGGIKLNAKEMALAYGIGALIFWTVASYFSGAAALGAALTFGAMIYTVHWIPNRLTNFLNDVPGVTTGMIDGIKQYTLNGVVPILAVISLVFGIQSIVRTVQRRRRERAEADRLHREQEAAVQAQQLPEPVATYPVAGGDYQPDNRFGDNFGNSNYDDLFEDEPAPFAPRNQADEQTAQFDPAAAAMEYPEDERNETRENENERADETILVSTDADETALVPTTDKTVADGSDPDETVATPPQNGGTQASASHKDGTDEAAAQQAPLAEPQAAGPQGGVAQGTAGAEEAAARQAPVAEPEATRPAPVTAPEATQPVAVPVPEEETPRHVTPPLAGGVPEGGSPQAGGPQGGVTAGSASQGAGAPGAASQVDDGGEATQPMPVARPEAAKPAAPQAGLQRREEIGQQYRERMDPPDVDDTGEFFVGAFENPGEQTQPTMELPGRFRPAGT